MPTTFKKVLDEVRGVPKPEVRRSLLEDLLAAEMGKSSVQKIVDSQVAIVAKREYAAMMAEMEKVRKIEMAEQERQARINEMRLKNLKKARRKLKRLRSKNEQ